MDYPKTGTEPFYRLIALHKINKGTFEDWHESIGKKHAYPSHFLIWCKKQVEKGTALFANDVYCLAPQLVKYFDDFIASQEVKKDLTPSRLVSALTKPMSGYAASMTRHLPSDALRDINFINGDTSEEKFRGSVKNVL